MTNFEEIVEIFHGADGFNGVSEQQLSKLSEWMSEIDGVATNLFNSKNEDYVLTFIESVQAVSLSLLVGKGEMDLMKAMFLSTDKDFANFIALVIKLSVGLSATEELR